MQPPPAPATKLLVVVTAANERQATSARHELDKRRLPAHTQTLAVADPAGRRIGSGGGTLNALRAARDLLGDGWLDGRLIIIVHSGGDSQRAPSQSVCGKAWSLLPTQPPKAPVDLLLEQLLKLCAGASGVVVACGDVLLKLPAEPGSLTMHKGVTGLGIRASKDYGPRHGVYVATDGRCADYLQKASLPELERAGAVVDGSVALDSGVVFFDKETARVLEGLSDAALVHRVELYGDLIQALHGGGVADEAAFLSLKSDASVVLRRLLWDALHAIPLHVLTPAQAAFAHVGTTQELLDVVCRPSPFREGLDLRAVANSVGAASVEDGVRGVLLNSLIMDGASSLVAGSLVEHSRLPSSSVVGANCVVSGVRALPAGFALPASCLLQQTQLADGRFVCVLMGVNDDVKASLDGGTLLGEPWAAVLERLQASAEDVWPGEPGTLWTAKLWPACATPIEATEATAGLLGDHEAWWAHEADWLSLSDILRLSDRMAEVRWREVLQDHIARTVTATAPLRVDLAGGWSDTPPISNEAGGAVCNVAVTLDGARPVGCRAAPLGTKELVLRAGDVVCVVSSLADLEDRSDPRAPCALLKCACVVAGIVDVEGPPLQDQLAQGLEISSWSRVPTGSGLGTSSILAACVVAVLKGDAASKQQLVVDALAVEAELTTRGGWQDQVGGVYPGFKLAISARAAELELSVKELPGENIHLVLIYTGTARLARDILERVLDRWRAKEGSVVADVAALVAGAKRSAAAVVRGDAAAVGDELDRYWVLKRAMAAGAQPSRVAAMLEALRRADVIHGAALCGAGGGGFLVAVTKKPDDRAGVLDALGVWKAGVSIHACEVDREGLVVTRGASP